MKEMFIILKVIDVLPIVLNRVQKRGIIVTEWRA